MEWAEEQVKRISKKHGLSHIGSCISVLPILREIYRKKDIKDKVGLGGAHAHLAHLMFIDYDNAEDLIEKYGIHCDKRAGCDVSGGSLGHTGGILLGWAVAEPDVDFYWIITDGEAQEGSVWETLAIKKRLKITNLKVYTNLNGYTAVEKIDREELVERLRVFCPDINIRYGFNGEEFDSVDGHYMTL